MTSLTLSPQTGEAHFELVCRDKLFLVQFSCAGNTIWTNRVVDSYQSVRPTKHCRRTQTFGERSFAAKTGLSFHCKLHQTTHRRRSHTDRSRMISRHYNQHHVLEAHT